MLKTSVVSLILTASTFGNVYINWILFQPTKQELQTGILTTDRKNKLLVSHLVAEGLYPVIVSGICTTIQPYVLIPMWFTTTAAFATHIQRKSIPVPKVPTLQEQFYMLQHDIPDEGEVMPDEVEVPLDENGKPILSGEFEEVDRKDTNKIIWEQ
jgi:hypothetical protein